MREIRYVLENIHTKKIHLKWYTIEQIEQEGLAVLYDIENYIILHRDDYTGLKDKNGEKIFEGDIVIHPELEAPHSIIWSTFSCRFYMTSTGVLKRPIYKYRAIRLTIIGNIHQDKHLIK